MSTGRMETMEPPESTSGAAGVGPTDPDEPALPPPTTAMRPIGPFSLLMAPSPVTVSRVSAGVRIVGG